ncbi:hypothetical protein, partial [Escherichia coli]|uniref:hypothetical protein n=1 Tax=Escherichia coli TaxID=562 RepID=UPI003D92CA05
RTPDATLYASYQALYYPSSAEKIGQFSLPAVRCINLRNRLEPKARYGMRTAGRENWPIFSALEG